MTGYEQRPSIWYYFGGKRRRYYPDVFLPSSARIIEVKSQWTYLIWTRMSKKCGLALKLDIVQS
jgi:hypothetical protein